MICGKQPLIDLYFVILRYPFQFPEPKEKERMTYDATDIRGDSSLVKHYMNRSDMCKFV